MATNTLNVRMKQAVRTEAEWTSDNPVLLEGEVAYSSDKNNMYKVGDGTKTWSQLPYGTHTRNDLVPIETHTYTDIIATENSEAKANFYWATVMPDDYNLPCMVRYRITATVPNETRAKTISDCTSLIVQSAVPAYSDFNIVLNTSYRSIYSNIVYRATSTGITNEYGHALGTRLYSAWSPTNTSYKRTLKIELLETYNCSVTFFNTPVLYENLPGTGTTNYSALTYEDAANSGLQEIGDNNTINEYAGGIVAGTNGLKAYALCMKVNDNQWESVVLSSTTAASKTKNSNGFLIDSPILYCNTSYNSGATSIASATYFVNWAIDLRYSINNASSSWTANGRPFFLVGTITDNKFYLKDTTWWADAIPTTADNYYYWYVGQTIGGYQGALHPNHPFYKFINGVFTQVDPLIYADSINVTTINGATVGSTPKFTDTVTTATTSGNGNAVTAITASNGALTVTKGTTFLTSHQDISGKADKSATVSNVAWDSTNKKLTKTINGTTSDVVTAATLRSAINVADGAEVNQNAFSNVTIGSTTIAADTKTDTLTLVAGSNITLTPDATNDKITIAATDTNTDTKVTNTLNNTAKAYLTGTTSASTNTGTQVFDSGIYATTTAGQLNATTYKVNEKVTLQYDTSADCLNFVFS